MRANESEGAGPREAETMAVDSGKVQGRRTVHYDSMDDLLEDAERLAKVKTRTLGNWSVGQIYKHLAASLGASIDGFPFNLPTPVQWLMRLTVKQRFLTKPLKPGFQMPTKVAKTMMPADGTSTEEGLAALRAAVERIKNTPTRATNAMFGTLTRAESDQFHLRHAEMHMSFIVPQ